MPNNKYESMGASIKLTHDFNRFLRVHFDVRSTLRNDRSSASPVNPLDYATYANPYERPYDDNGNYVYDRSSYSTKSSIKDGYEYDFNILEDSANDCYYFGLTTNGGFGTPGAELHIELNETVIFKKTKKI